MAFTHPSRPMIAENNSEGYRLVRRYIAREHFLFSLVLVGIPLAVISLFFWGGYLLFEQTQSMRGVRPYVTLTLAYSAFSIPAGYLSVFVYRSSRMILNEYRHRDDYVKEQLRPIYHKHHFELLEECRGKLPVVDDFIRSIEDQGRVLTVFEMDSVFLFLSKVKK